MSLSSPKSAPESRPCPSCHHPPSRGRPTAALSSLDSLLKGAESGCLSCSVLSAGIKSVIGDDVSPDTRSQDSGEWFRMDMGMGVSGQSLNLTLFKRELEISVFAPPQSKTPEFECLFPTIPVGDLNLPNRTDSEASLEWVLEKLRHCDNSHECRQKNSDSKGARPQRILYIGSTNNDYVRLKAFDTDDVAIPKYACLSHCWGASKPSSTTTANLASHEQGIPRSTLPPLFQDTIKYVRRLGISLLWIDSLCIIQDDKEDWRKEAAKMASVYQNAYLVISASKSSGSGDSLFGEVDEQLKPSIIPVPSLGQGSAVCFRKSLTHMPGYMDQKFAKPSPLPTFNRGWIFQERLLSSRILHFGPQELSWECLQESACQCTGHYAPSATVDPVDMAWHMIVEDYTRLHLTFETDVFPAISGIAKRFQSSLGSEYVAGLWTKSLIDDLAWHKENTTGDSTKQIEWQQRPKAWRAPTWSWGAVRGHVEFLDIGTGTSALCKVEEVKCSTYQSDPTGELKNGHLLLRGYLIPTSIQYKASVKPNERKPFDLFELDIMQGQVGNVWADYDSSTPGDAYIAPGTTVKCFVLSTRLDSGSLVLLILKEAGYDETRCCAVWQRLGLVQLSRPPTVLAEAKDYWFDVFKGRLSDETLVKII
ncbi:heterokaryon incompatibility protein (HET) domain-containing protein [Trichoderma breve]|uniref:Heterokaryon incompatibility protein (HET) domain-containing protein n=1 Tax=Trichoderma breve TaxID=2034170 RepID=A0A9W9E3Z5_9HYPO|nr:heterokaryon incompatibility protein (HET) domain-containing protein [Trichoderma breve]KAJ4855727.1 heterokaryon incompatibility protein (HET) domain-containing protein [Trichoderma breve]